MRLILIILLILSMCAFAADYPDNKSPWEDIRASNSLYINHTSPIEQRTGISFFEPIPRESVFSCRSTTDLLFGIDTLVIDTNHTQYGNVIVFNDGVLIVDSATLTMHGSVIGSGNGVIIFRNGARLHFEQHYIGEY